MQAWLNGSQANDGLALVANSTFNASFDSKENTTTSHPPELDIVFAGGGGGITGMSISGWQRNAGRRHERHAQPVADECVRGHSGAAVEWQFVGMRFRWRGYDHGRNCGNGRPGGGAGGTVMLNVDTTKVPQLGTTNTFMATQAIGSSDVFDQQRQP